MAELTNHPPIEPDVTVTSMMYEAAMAEENGTRPPEAAALEQHHPAAVGTAGNLAVEQTVGQTSPEPGPAKKLHYLTGELQHLTDVELASKHGTEEARQVTKKFVEAQDLAAVLGGDFKASDLVPLIRELDKLQDASRLTVAELLDHVKPELLGDLFAMGDPDLTSLLEKTVEIKRQHSLDVGILARVVEQAVSPTYGRMITWKRNGQIASEAYPDFMKKIIEHPRFAGLCADSELKRILAEDTGSGMQNRYRLRETEKEILQEVLGVPKDMADDYRLSLRTRTALKNENGSYMATDLRLGGVDGSEWAAILRRYGAIVSSLGLDTAVQLYRQAEIVNFDFYPFSQLALTKRVVVDRDPQTIKDLQKKDVTVSFADAFSDILNIGDSTPRGDTLIFELTRPTSLYRHFARLRGAGIKPCTAAINSHGHTTGLAFGQGTQEFYFTAGQSDEENNYSIERSSVRRLVHEYMQPSKKTGERAVLLLACLQAAGDQASPAHILTAQTRRNDRVVVKAAAESAGVTTVDGRLLFVKTDNTPLQTVEFRRSRWPGKKVRQTRPPKGTSLT